MAPLRLFCATPFVSHLETWALRALVERRSAMTKKLTTTLGGLSLAIGALLSAERLLPPGQAQLAPLIRTINITVNEMVYDPMSKKIYATVPSSAGDSGNSVTVIDPVTANVGPSIF